MKLVIAENAQQVNYMAADMIEDLVKRKTDCVLGLATGSTPVGTYQELIARYDQNIIDFSQVTTFNLDEYYGLDVEHPQSYHTFMAKNLFDHINIPKNQINIPSGTVKDATEHCATYEKVILEAGGIDLQILGIGGNGHIGFNEPAEELRARTHLVELKEETIEANSRFFNDKEEVPKHAITMGIGTIFQARKILLIAVGEGKAKIIQDLLQSEITTNLPASMLKLHRDVTILVDRDAACLIDDHLI